MATLLVMVRNYAAPLNPTMNNRQAPLRTYPAAKTWDIMSLTN